MHAAENLMIITTLISTLIGMTGAWLIAKYAPSFGLLDVPNDRSSHQVPTPRGGGIGILAAFTLVSIYIQSPWYLWGPTVFLAVLSFFDDRLALSALFRLALQFGAAAFFLGFSNLFSSQIVFLSLFLIFIVGTANFYNFMDGINGIAGMTGVVAFGLLAWVAWSRDDTVILPIALALAGASLGFLPFNIPSAKVFMGDVGSVLLGFVFALLVLLLAESWVEFFAFSGLLFPFYADELLTMAERMKSGQPLLKAHRQHLYQVLANEYQIAHWKVSLGYASLQLMIGVAAILTSRFGIAGVLVLFVFIGAVSAWVNWKIKKKLNLQKI